MHYSSTENMKTAIQLLPKLKKVKILDVGGRSTSDKEDRSYKNLFENTYAEYHIADIVAGSNVTHHMKKEYMIPADGNYYDVIVSGQTLEHVKNPFRLVNEMVRVLKPNGHIILIAPSSGPHHDSVDCWRFLKDSFKGIAEETNLEIIADWIDNDHNDKGSKRWRDHVFVGKKIPLNEIKIGINKRRTICEVHREMYDIVLADVLEKNIKEQLISRLEESYSMGKKMSLKLQQYKFNYDENWWEKESKLLKTQKHLLRSEREKSMKNNYKDE